MTQPQTPQASRRFVPPGEPPIPAAAPGAAPSSTGYPPEPPSYWGAPAPGPVAGWPPNWAPPAGPSARKRRLWPWVVGASVAAVLLLVGAVAVLLSEEPSWSEARVVVEEDFASGPGDFSELFEETAIGEQRDGEFVFTTSDQGRPVDSHVMLDLSDAVDVEASLALTAGADGEDAVGLAAFDPDGRGYSFQVARDGTAMLQNYSDGDFRTLATEQSAPVSGPLRLRLTVLRTNSGTEVIGYVDGVRALEITDDRGLDRFYAAGGFARAGRGGAQISATFDDVIIRTVHAVPRW
jgi:hypothetical protein